MANKTPFINTLLQQYNNFEEFTLYQISEVSFDDGYMVYRIHHPGGQDFVARVYRRGQVLPDWFQYFYPWVTGGIAEWLETRANTLCYLEQLNYPAPRVLRNRAGEPVSSTSEWCVFITGFVNGIQLKPTLEQLRLLGSALGSLHSLKIECQPPAIQPFSPGKSYWDLEYGLSTVQKQLQSTGHLLSEEMRPLHAEFSQNIQRLRQLQGLSQTVIHGDAWAANAVQVSNEQAILIDWDTSGLGPPIFDLGRLLLECHLDSETPLDNPLAWHIHPDEQRIGAVVAGYKQHRKPTLLELENLLDALRFGVTFIGALHFNQVLQTENPTPQWESGMQRRFARLQNRWEASVEIASLARSQFDQESN